MRNLLKIGLWLCMLWLIGCQTAVSLPSTITPPPKTVLNIGVPSGVLPSLVGEVYEQLHPDMQLQFVVGHPQTLWSDLQNGQVDAIFTYIITLDNTNWFNPVALDGLTIITHPTQSQTAFSSNEIVSLFARDSGKTVYVPATGSAEYILFTEQLMGNNRLTINAQILPNDIAIHDAVTNDEQGVGVLFLSAVTDDVTAVTLDNTPPTQNSVSTQTYPLTTPLYFVHNSAEEPQGELRALLAWLQSAEGQAILGERFGRVR